MCIRDRYQAAHVAGRQAQRQQVAQLGQGSLGGHVAAAHGTGIGLAAFDDFKVGDILEFYVKERVK